MYEYEPVEKMCLGYQRVFSHLSAWADCPGGAAPFTISFCYLCLMLYDGRVLFGSSPVDFPYEVRRTILYL